MKRTLICIMAALLLSGCTKPAVPDNSPATCATDDEALPSETQPLETHRTEPPADPTVPTATVPAETVTTTQMPTVTELPTAPELLQGATVCSHDYRAGFYQAPTCEQAGYQNYRCEKCGDLQQQISLPLGHSYTDSTCTAAKYCTRCAMTVGVALGHDYRSGLCCRCGEKDPSLRTITITVKDTGNAPVDGVTVELHIADTLHSTAVSRGGQVVFTVQNHPGSYTLVLTGVPEGYKARKDRYTYRSDTGAIVLEPVPVIDPDDHSKAAYKVGSTMGEFTLTDVDGKTHQLSELLQEKKLVILNFWYSTCVPCKAEFSYFNSVYQRYHHEIEILALNHFDSEVTIRQMQAEMELSFPLAAEHLGMQQGFGIQSYPVSVFIGAEGRIIHIHKNIGFQSETELDTLIRQLIGSPSN